MNLDTLKIALRLFTIVYSLGFLIGTWYYTRRLDMPKWIRLSIMTLLSVVLLILVYDHALIQR